MEYCYACTTQVDKMKLLVFVCLLAYMQLTFSSANVLKCCRKPDTFTLDCSGCKLEHIPHLSDTTCITSLNLNNNLIKDIEDFAFINLTSLKVLTIRNNRLRTVSNNSFAGLKSLEILDTTQRDEYIISSETFKPLIALKTLKLGVICPSLDSFPKEAFVHLSAGLRTLELAVPPYFVFGKEFAHLQILETLVLFGHKCSIRNVTRETFSVFSNSLQTLEVHDCETNNLDTHFLKNFAKLETLNFACNKKMNILDVFEAIKGMPSSTLKTLIADGVHSGRTDFNRMKPEWFNSSRFENLTRLSLRLTNIISLDMDSFYYIPKIEFFNFGYNTLLQGKVGNVTELITFLDKSNITAIDISYYGQSVSAGNIFRQRYCRDVDIHSNDFFRKHPPYIIIPDPVPCCNHTIITNGSLDYIVGRNVPQSLLFLYAESLGFPAGEIYSAEVNSDNNGLFLDVSNTVVRRVNGIIKGLNKLQGLDISRCGMEYINPEFLDHLPSLTFLNISWNELLGTPWDRFFKNAKSLRTLDLSSNRLESVPANISDGLVSLETILLSGNLLGKMFISLENNRNLTLLDLRNTSWVPSLKFMEELDNFQSRVNQSLQLKLQGIIFQCECSNVDFLKWLKKTDVDVVDEKTLQCNYKKRLRYITSVDVYGLEYVCTERMRLLTIFITPLASAVVVIVLVVVVHNYRWSIKWRFYLLRRSFFHRRLQRHDGIMAPLLSENTTYHAFVSYNHKDDYQWVQDALLPEVEDEWGLRLCIGQRDFIPGIPIAENICKAIDDSRYIILVITPSFISSEWCDFEMHMALVKGRNHLIIVYKQDVDTNAMSRTMRSLMSSLNYIEYSETPDGNALFWRRLKDKLTSHINPADA